MTHPPKHGGHSHEHNHHDHHDHHDHEHHHDTQQPVAPPGYFQLMETVVRELLVEKGLIQPNDIRRAVELMDARTGPARGAKLVAKAWLDEQFKARLLADGKAACEEMGFGVGDSKMPADLKVVENTPDTHNVIVCTLCSCYPRFLMGIPPDWYKSRSYRSRVVNEPRKVLQEFGTALPSDVRIVVHDSTADLRYMVLPLRPAGTEGLTEDQLAALITRDALVGVTLVPGPEI